MMSSGAKYSALQAPSPSTTPSNCHSSPRSPSSNINGPLKGRNNLDRTSCSPTAVTLVSGQGSAMLPPKNAQKDTSENMEFNQTHFQIPFSDEALQQGIGSSISQQSLFFLNSNPFVGVPPRVLGVGGTGPKAQSSKKALPNRTLSPVENAQLTLSEESSKNTKEGHLHNHHHHHHHHQPSNKTGLSPLHMAAFSNLGNQSVITSSNNLNSLALSSSPMFARTNVLRYQTSVGGDAMLSSINYVGENEILQEGGFDIPVSSGFNSLDGLLGTGMSNHSGSGSLRLPDLLEGEVSSQEGSYLETKRPHTGVLQETLSSQIPSGGGTLEKGKLKGNKSISPNNRASGQPCPTCGKVFSNSSALTKHKLTHSDERKFVCQLCSKAFKRQDHLNGHMLTHRNKKPYECDIEGCGKSYCDARSLRRHKENHHHNNNLLGPLPGTTAVIAMPTSSASQLHLIPSIPQLSLDTLQSALSQTSFLPNGSSLDPTSMSNNRIRYAPAASFSPGTQFSADTATINQILGQVLPSASSQLQLLAFHQQPSNSSVLTTPQPSTTPPTQVSQQSPAPLPSRNSRNSPEKIPAQRTDNSSQRVNNSQVLESSWQKYPLNMDSASFMLNESYSGLPPSNPVGSLIVKANDSSKIKDGNLTEQNRVLMEDYKRFPDRSSSPVSQSTLESIMEYAASSSNVSGLLREQGSCLPLSVGSPNNSRPNSQKSCEPPERIIITGGRGGGSDSPLLQQLLTPQDGSQPANEMRAQANFSLPIQEHHSAIIAQYDQHLGCLTDDNNSFQLENLPKPVECSICPRKFKNLSALNGHMRLHGGYFKKEVEIIQKPDSKPAFQSAASCSVNVRALIEEKIIQRQAAQRCVIMEKESQDSPASEVSHLPFINDNFSMALPNQPSLDTDELMEDSQGFQMQDDLPAPTNAEDSLVPHSPLPATPLDSSPFIPIQEPDDSQSSSPLSYPSHVPKSSVEEIRQQFRVPRPVVQKHRRHSDSDHFLCAKKPYNDPIATASNLLRHKTASRRTTRTGSDPGGDPFQLMLPFSSDFDFDNLRLGHCTQQHAESLPATPTYKHLPELFPILSPPPDHPGEDHNGHDPGGGAPSSHFSFLERDLELASALESSAPSLPEYLSYPSEEPGMSCSGSNLGLVNSEAVMEAHHQQNVFGEPDLLETDYSPICNNLMLVEPCGNGNMIIDPMDVKREPQEQQELIKMESPHHIENSWAMNVDETDDDVFLSPTPASPVKAKRKHRPEPLYIPPHVNTGGVIFASRLRSPRLWDPAGYESKTLSPPPYTPPPMLSPVRNGPGLFWHMVSSSSAAGNITPMSAPITPNFLMKKVSVSFTEEPIEEEFKISTPETDIQPHVNIGSQFQAKLPKCQAGRAEADALLEYEKADPIWDPSVVDGIPTEEVNLYLEFACCACVTGGGRNKEYALHILQLTGGNIQEAVLRLMDPDPKLPKGHPLLTYQYAEAGKWLSNESDSFHRALVKFDKDFYNISKEVGTKSVKECVEFYYVWKKICPDDYKRLRTLRRKREQDAYNLRTGKGVNNTEGGELSRMVLERLHEDVKSNVSLPLNGSSLHNSPGRRTPPSGRRTPPSPSTEVPVVLGHFPCKICGKVFPKVKSRSAHMKSHRQIEADKSKGK